MIEYIREEAESIQLQDGSYITNYGQCHHSESHQ